MTLALQDIDEGDVEEREWLESILVLMADVRSALLLQSGSESHSEL